MPILCGRLKTKDRIMRLILIVFIAVFFVNCEQTNSQNEETPKDSTDKIISETTEIPEGIDTSANSFNSLTFDYFIDLMSQGKHIPNYLYKYFPRDLVQSLRNQEEIHGFTYVMGRSHKKLDNIHLVTFETGAGSPCQVQHIATYNLEGSVIAHIKCSACDCNEPYCRTESFTLKSDKLFEVKTEITETDEYGEIANEIYKSYSIKSNGVFVLINENVVANEIYWKAREFIISLKDGKNSSLFFADNWTFIYYEEDRVDGLIGGEIDSLRPAQIDTIIRLRVNSDGNGWGDKNAPKSYDLDFDIKNHAAWWDRLVILTEFSNLKENIAYIDLGASPTMELYYDDNYQIIKLEYRIEDPG